MKTHYLEPTVDSILLTKWYLKIATYKSCTTVLLLNRLHKTSNNWSIYFEKVNPIKEDEQKQLFYCKKNLLLFAPETYRYSPSSTTEKNSTPEICKLCQLFFIFLFWIKFLHEYVAYHLFTYLFTYRIFLPVVKLKKKKKTIK